MNKTDLLLQMMEQPQHYTAEEWQEILADEECREIYTLLSKTQSAIDAARADQEVTDDMIDAEWQRLSDEKQEVREKRKIFAPKVRRYVCGHSHAFRHCLCSHPHRQSL